MSENTITTGDQTDTTISAIDAALAASNARKAAKNAGKPTGTGPVVAAPAGDKPKRTVLTPEQRKERLDKIEAERADRKSKRQDERNAKRAEAVADAKPAHMKKVEKAAEGLPVLSDEAQAVFASATASLPTAEVQALAAHLQHHARVQATQGALEADLKVGQEVEVVTGDSRFIGLRGVTTKVSRIRCYVSFTGREKLGYFYTSDVRAVEAPEEAPASVETTEDASA